MEDQLKEILEQLKQLRNEVARVKNRADQLGSDMQDNFGILDRKIKEELKKIKGYNE
jgi:hypothetical protein